MASDLSDSSNRELELLDEIERLCSIISEVNIWFGCYCIATPVDGMMQNAERILEILLLIT